MASWKFRPSTWIWKRMPSASWCHRGSSTRWIVPDEERRSSSGPNLMEAYRFAATARWWWIRYWNFTRSRRSKINMPFNLCRYSRLPFGFASAPGKSQWVLVNLFRDLPCGKCYLTGRNEEEHWAPKSFGGCSLSDCSCSWKGACFLRPSSHILNLLYPRMAWDIWRSASGVGDWTTRKFAVAADFRRSGEQLQKVYTAVGVGSTPSVSSLEEGGTLALDI